MCEEPRLHSIWRGMRQRCENPNACNAKYYHSKGIRVCLRWHRSFTAFERWARKHGYEARKSLDRINPNGNYSPQNCAWVAIEAQASNKTCTRWVDGMPLKHYCQQQGLNYSTIHARVRSGKTVEEAIGRTTLC